MGKKESKTLYISKGALKRLIDGKRIDVTPEGYRLSIGGKLLAVVDEIPAGEKEVNWKKELEKALPEKEVEEDSK